MYLKALYPLKDTAKRGIYMVKYKIESEFALIMPQKLLLNLSQPEA